MAKLDLLFIAFKRESPWPTFRCLFVQWLKFVIFGQRVLIRGNLNNDAENFKYQSHRGNGHRKRMVDIISPIRNRNSMHD